MTSNPVFWRTATPALDFSRVRAQTSGAPRNFLSYGTVGHYDDTPAYTRVEEGDVLVEVTLAPSGDEVVARLDLEAMDSGGVYFPLSYGQRVVVAFPNAEQGDPVIVARLSDASWPFPDEVGGIPTDPTPNPQVRAAPMFAFMKTGDGQLLVIETGESGDIVVHSGASAQVRVAPSDQILLTGRTHIGSEAQFAAEPEGAQVADNGFVTDGVAAEPYEPAPNTNAVTPAATYITPTGTAPLPADGIMRLKDTVQSNNLVDAEFWNFVRTVYNALFTIIPLFNTPPGTPVVGLGPGTIIPVGIAPGVPGVPLDGPPQSLDSIGRTSSQNTASDD